MEYSSINAESGRRDNIAIAQRLGANVFSLCRVGVGCGILWYSVSKDSYRSIPMAAIVAGASATDYIDGNLARRAAKRLQSATTRFGNWIDQLSDKAFTHLSFMGFGINSVVNGNIPEKLYGGAMLGMDSAIVYRDYRATKIRIDAEGSYDIKARPQGKAKAALGMICLTAAASPLADSTVGQVGVGIGLAATTVLAMRSLHDLEASFAEVIPLTDAA